MTSEEFKLRLQLETTLLVWVRTSLSLMGFGFVIARFGLFLREIAEVGTATVAAHPRLALINSITGTTTILIGVTVMLVSVFNHLHMVKRLERGDLSPPARWSLSVLLSLGIAALGAGMAVYLAIIEL